MHLISYSRQTPSKEYKHILVKNLGIPRLEFCPHKFGNSTNCEKKKKKEIPAFIRQKTV